MRWKLSAPPGARSADVATDGWLAAKEQTLSVMMQALWRMVPKGSTARPSQRRPCMGGPATETRRHRLYQARRNLGWRKGATSSIGGVTA